GGAGAGAPESRAGDYDAALAGAPRALAALYEQGDVLLDGGPEAFERQLAELEGHPVVVNKWASWCGPCRFEFPFFQSQAATHGDRIAFLGVDSDDSEDAARTFLDQFPVPYPSFSDPDSEIARLLDAREFPSTAFFDSAGELVYTHRGGYASEADLAAEIERYARRQPRH
ncbi:MAG: TlpA family protein disulfide reductase, partial [Solirubrobacterales bacterium]